MVPTDCDEQLLDVAERVNGEVTCSPLEGLLMLTLANAGTAAMETRRRGEKKSLMNLPRHVRTCPLGVELRLLELHYVSGGVKNGS
jgi:hypothetical protein